MTPLPCFTVTGNVHELPGTTASGELTVAALTGGMVSFHPNIGSELFLWESKLYRVAPVQVMVGSDGTLSIAGSPVKLLANDPGLNFSNLQWQASIQRPNNGSPVKWWFDAPLDGQSINLAAVALAPGAPSPPTSGTDLFTPPDTRNLPLSKGSDLYCTFVHRALVDDVWTETNYPSGATVALTVETSTPLVSNATISGSVATVWEDKSVANAIPSGKPWRAVITYTGGLERVMVHGLTARYDGFD